MLRIVRGSRRISKLPDHTALNADEIDASPLLELIKHSEGDVAAASVAALVALSPSRIDAAVDIVISNASQVDITAVVAALAQTGHPAVAHLISELANPS